MLSVRLPDEMEKKLEYLSVETGRSKTYYIKEALELYLEDMEERYIVAQRLSKPVKKYYTMDEIEEKYGLLDD